MDLNSDKGFHKSVFRFLRFICPEHLFEEIEGDLIQKFYQDESRFGRQNAKRNLFWRTIKFVRPGIILRNSFSKQFNHVNMFHHYFKTSYRHIGRNKMNFSFKLGGLTLAICSLLIIVLYVSYQRSFDRFHEDYENIYRVNSNRDEDGKIVPYAMVPPAIGPALQENFPEVKAFTRFGVSSRVMINYQDKLLRLPGFIEADSSIFDVFTFNFIRGNKDALVQPGSVVLTQSLARQIFGDEDPMNKVVSSPDHADRTLQVTAIVEDFPSNAHLTINAIHSIGALQKSDFNSWEITWDGSVNLYVKLSPQANADEIGRKSVSLLRNNIVADEDGSDKRFSIYLQPLKDIYLDTALKMEFGKKGNALFLYIFLLLGVFLLLIACTNYVNLSIADFDTRTREIGVRKVLGARKRQISYQVAMEAAGISLLALLFAVFILYESFPTISSLLDPNLRFEMLLDKSVIALGGIVLLLIILFSSAYPSYQLATQSTTDELRSGTGHIKGMRMGRLLLVTQYVISIVCVCATITIGMQISFIQESDLGYDRTSVVSLVMPDEYPIENVTILKNEIASIAGVEAASYSYYLMPISTYFKGWYKIEKDGKMEKALLNEMFIDHDYLEVMGIKLLSGRNFIAGNIADTRTAFIINETAAREFGWTNPIGKRISVGHSGEASNETEGSIVGVVKDFNTLSLHRKIEPVVLRLQYDTWPGNALNVKVKGSVADLLPSITSTYEKVMTGFLADSRILGDMHNRQYQEEKKTFASLQIGTLVVTLVSALGIFSLSSYMSIKRMKEFGIRKVLGATVPQIASLHISYFFKITVLANIIALPVSYWLMREWLADFAYHTELSGLVFLMVMLMSFVLVLISGGYSAWKAGVKNPIEVINTQ